MDDRYADANENLDRAWSGLRAAFAKFASHGELSADQILQLRKDWQRYKFAAATLKFYGDEPPPHLRENPDSELIIALTTLRSRGYIDPFPPI